MRSILALALMIVFSAAGVVSADCQGNSCKATPQASVTYFQIPQHTVTYTVEPVYKTRKVKFKVPVLKEFRVKAQPVTTSGCTDCKCSAK